jgi:hypothetical protein
MIVCSAMLSGDISFSPMYFVLQIFSFRPYLSYHHCKCLKSLDLYQENSLGLFNHHLLPEAPVSYNQPFIQARIYTDLLAKTQNSKLHRRNCVRRQSSFGASPQHPSTQPATLALPCYALASISSLPPIMPPKSGRKKKKNAPLNFFASQHQNQPL